jgi:tellurite resistance protein
MAAEEKQLVNDALETLVNITEKSGNLRKDLKNDIHVSVSTLRKSFSHLIHQLDNVKEEYKRYKEEVKKAMKSSVTEGLSQPTRQVAPSLDHTQQSQSSRAPQIMTSGGERRKLFSEVVKNQESNKRYRITLKPKEENITPEQIKSQLKKSIKLTDIKVGIKAVKSIRDRGLVIETDRLEERNILSTEIINRLGEKLDIIQHKLRKLRVIICSVPEEITVGKSRSHQCSKSRSHNQGQNHRSQV